MVLRGQVSSSLPLCDLERVANEVGLSLIELLNVEAVVEPSDNPADDEMTLATLLVSEKTMHMPDRLARSLGWTLDRLATARESLDTHLHPVGLKIHKNSMGITIRPLDCRADAALSRLAELRDDEDGIKQGMARVLFAAQQGRLSNRETGNDTNVQLHALHNRGAMSFGNASQRNVVSDDCAYSFEVPE